ncbi:energy transducer TonB [Granulicella tundricola]|uniref:TonB-like protein n=1 Tax=Granulicella tundricola (strain ATCC BAA-1859 / DSM 23138 / MP5ACTX9) TaxID=1198114 RepID=E8X4X0_GRATM|nr:TonB-like protein [Granulicella tundricola]ADW70609.1 TonB-like protein [Granulicella tundricola MP5ACTX9]
MPSLETPPNPAPPTPPPAQQPPVRLQTRRFGELEEHELIHLLDSLDDERSRSRFRESIYVSLLFYVALAWFVLYGPRVLWHSPQIVPVETKRDNKELTYLETPKDLLKHIPKPTTVISDKSAVAQTAHPTPEAKRGTPPPQAAAPRPAPRPLPPTPQPQQQAPPQQQAQVQPQPQQPKPLPPQPAHPQPSQAAIPDAPRPSQSTRPNFGTPMTPGQSIAQAAHDAASGGGQGAGGDNGTGARPGHPGTNTGAEILSDTLGVDFGPYIQRLLRMVRAAWIPLIPEETRPPISKEGSTLIRFTILPDGRLKIGGMHLDASTHDRAIDEAAWGGIVGVGQYPPLPANFKGPELTLRIQFNIVQNHRGAE